MDFRVSKDYKGGPIKDVRSLNPNTEKVPEGKKKLLEKVKREKTIKMLK